MNSPENSTARTYRPQLSRDQRDAVQTLRRYGLSLQAIAIQLGISHRQAQYASERADVSDPQGPVHPSILSVCQVDELEHFVRSSRNGRFMTYLELSTYPFSHWNIEEHVIRRALHKRGYRRCISRLKPPLTEENKMKRLQFAREHLEWTIEQWNQILWTDESWITGGQHTRVFVTRKANFITIFYCYVVLMKDISLENSLMKLVYLPYLRAGMGGCFGVPSLAQKKVPFLYGIRDGAHSQRDYTVNEFCLA